ncbi:hypothetical protein SAMN02745121_03769 [Nannocystis exedens]|uniref:Uncharacterized protein n=1 Tax=Nannocystis exedens TaxID=54 RepID=A0A1I1ZHE3_9BACT|nr:hypothetical protein [Nannocystis exedens]PCC75025.1 hypothetical protein NAEX_08128 [Nannocystis exedens]SFE29760.1 hypothetical protein SAMN02745121_03769 [Nannocystis exedens]
MHFRSLLLPCLALSTLVYACTPDSKNIGDTLETDSDSTATSGDETGDPPVTASTPSTSDGTSGASSTGDDDSASDPSVSGTSGASSTGDDDSASDPSVSGTSGPDETTGASEGFERFTLRSVSGLCPPESDCDGFVELLSTGLLRVEKVGDLGNPVTEVEIDTEDFALALEVFTDPALIEVLDSPDPLCDPPTDMFEEMELELDGTLHEATTTVCPQAPLQAAREAAEELRLKYVP